MIKKGVVLAVTAFVVGSFPVSEAGAQMQGHMQRQAKGGQMMGQGMMGGMMGQSMHKGMMSGAMHGGFDFYLNRADQLGLSEVQVEQLRKLKFEFDKANVRRKADLQVAKLELKELKATPEVDAKKVEAKIREVHNLQAQIEANGFQAELNAKAVLTDEQKAKLNELACCGQTQGPGMMNGGGMMQPGGMMRQGQQEQDASQHQEHHKN